MPNNYQFVDAFGSVLTARSSITSGSAQEPYITITSFLSAVPTTASGNQSVSGTVNVGNSPSIYGNVSGSVVSFPGANQSVSGTVNVGNAPSVYGNISGSVLSQQLGTHVTSVVGSIPSSLLTGDYGHRNDAIASYLGGNLTWNPKATDSAGRTLVRPFAAEESRLEGYASTVNVSVTTLVAAAGAGLRNYITDLWFANTGSVATLITLRSGGGTSVLGYTIAPSGGGSNLPGLVTPIQTLANETFDFQATTGVSVLYATVKGFKAP